MKTSIPITPVRPVQTDTLLHTTLEEALQPHLPTTLVNLVNGYAATDYSEALLSIEYNKYGRYIDNARNAGILKAMQLALTSADCDPKIKRELFAARTNSRGLLDDVIESIHKEGLRINLDNTDFSGLDLGDLNLGNMTAKGASFVRTRLSRSVFRGANLTGASFTCCLIRRSDWRHTTLIGTTWHRVELALTDMSYADLSGAMMVRTAFLGTFVNKLLTDDVLLKNVIRASNDATSLFKLLGEAKIVGVYSTGIGLDMALQDLAQHTVTQLDLGFL